MAAVCLPLTSIWKHPESRIYYSEKSRDQNRQKDLLILFMTFFLTVKNPHLLVRKRTIRS